MPGSMRPLGGASSRQFFSIQYVRQTYIRRFTKLLERAIIALKTEYRKSKGEPPRGVQGNGVQFFNRTAAVKRSAAHHAIGKSREGAQGDEAKSEDLPMDRVSLSSVSKKDMFRFRRMAARQFRRDVSAKNLIYPVFAVRVRIAVPNPPARQPALRSSEAGCARACTAGHLFRNGQE